MKLKDLKIAIFIINLTKYDNNSLKLTDMLIYNFNYSTMIIKMLAITNVIFKKYC